MWLDVACSVTMYNECTVTVTRRSTHTVVVFSPQMKTPPSSSILPYHIHRVLHTLHMYHLTDVNSIHCKSNMYIMGPSLPQILHQTINQTSSSSSSSNQTRYTRIRIRHISLTSSCLPQSQCISQQSLPLRS